MQHRRQLIGGAIALIVGLSEGVAQADVASRSYAGTLKEEASKAGLPFAVADAVMAIESGYDPSKIGGVGEIGLMQVRPSTAAMLGFKGSLADLARPEINIHYGVSYLAGAWRQANGDLCRALMKYRAGHGEEVMTPLSVSYCQRARAHLASIGSAFALAIVPAAAAIDHAASGPTSTPGLNPSIHMSSAAFWAAHTARIRLLNAAIERKWRRMAAR